MTIDEIQITYPNWDRRTCAEAWLGQMARETSRDHVAHEFDVDFDQNGEAMITPEQAERVWKQATA